MAMMPKAKHEDFEENVFWTTMSDLMLGLAVVFMTLFVLAISGFSAQKVEQKQKQLEASNEIVEKLQEQQVDAEVDKMSGDIKISDLELFEVFAMADGGDWECKVFGFKCLVLST